MLAIVRLYHDLLGTYGDAGNAKVLLHRLALRGITAELIDIRPNEPVPTQGHIYLLGGGEDGPQTAALELLRTDGGLNRAVTNNGASLLAVCAGFQLIGTELPGNDGQVAGLGLLDAATYYRQVPRSVGEVFATSTTNPEVLLTGFENHQGLTQIGDSVQPLGHVISGVGNGLAQESTPNGRPEGALVGKVFGTYMHGPVLARNPELADQILASQMGELAPIADEFANAFAVTRRQALGKPLAN
jgi:CobQ-like glutamine amidotransferase family enzyme